MPSETEYVLGQVASVFSELNVSFVVGDSIASSVYGFPRTTQDIDILADLGEEQAPKLVDRLRGSFYMTWTPFTSPKCWRLVERAANHRVFYKRCRTIII